MVSSFLGGYLSKVCILRWKRDLWFRLFSGDGEFSHYSELGNEWGIQEETFAITSENSVDLAIVQEVLEVLVLCIMVLCIMVKVVIESGVIDGVYIDMSVGVGKGFLEEGIMSLDVSSMDRVEVL